MSTQTGSPVLRTAVKLTFPVVLVFAGQHMVNVHVAPGGGFSGGLLVALAVLLLFVGLGSGEVEALVPFFSHWAMVAGLALALASAAIGLVAGDALLQSYTTEPEVLGGKLHLATSSLFDVGIFLVVSGGVVAIFRGVGLEEPRP